MSKLSFRARALDPCKPMPIFLAEELPDLPEYSAINRAVPQMPSGMEKEEESEHHLQRAICTGLIIPTPEVFVIDQDFYDTSYPPNYKMPRQLIHMQPLGLEQDIPDYDMDSADEVWMNSQARRLDLTPLKFEQMMDKLEKSSGQTVVTLNEAKALLKQDDEVSTAVYDYWLNKRLKTQHPLILSVKTENRSGTAANNPYLAFRRRTEKMQTRKNRKNDETSYEKMLKLRRDLSRAVTLLEMVKKREKNKREQLHLTIEVFEKRYQLRDFSGSVMSELSSSIKSSRPAFAPIYSNQYSHHSSATQSANLLSSSSGSSQQQQQQQQQHHNYSTSSYHPSGIGSVASTTGSTATKRDLDTGSRKEKRQYKKRKHKYQREKHYTAPHVASPAAVESTISSEGEDLAGSHLMGSEGEDEGLYAFRRNKNCEYQRPLTNGYGNWPWESKDENGLSDVKYRFTLTSVREPRPRCIGFARRRVGRGGRVILDRISTNADDMWSELDYTIFDSRTTQKSETDKRPVTDEDISRDTKFISSSVIPITNPPATTSTECNIKSELDSLDKNHACDQSIYNNSYSDLCSRLYSDYDESYRRRRNFKRSYRKLSSISQYLNKEIKQETPDEMMDVSDDHWATPLDQRDSGIVVDLVRTPCINSISNRNISGNNNIYASGYSSSGGGGGESSSTARNLFNKRNETNSGNVIKDEYATVIKQETDADVNNSDEENVNLASLSSILYASRDSAASSLIGNVKSDVGQMITHSNYMDLNTSTRLWHDEQKPETIVSTISDPKLGAVGVKEQSDGTDSIYKEFLDEIQKNWLHFRPKTPPPSPITEKKSPEDDIKSSVNFSEQTPIAIELQRIDSVSTPPQSPAPPSSVFTSKFDLDPMFITSEFSYNDLGGDEQPLFSNTTTDSSNSGIDFNISGDSLNELNLSLGEDDNEKMLENILEECQIDDLKTLNQTTTFWDGILEDGGLLDVIDDKKAIIPDANKAVDLLVNGTESGLLYEKDESKRFTSKHKGNPSKLKLGNSQFSVTNASHDEKFFTKVEPAPANMTMKCEPPEELLETPQSSQQRNNQMSATVSVPGVTAIVAGMNHPSIAGPINNRQAATIVGNNNPPIKVFIKQETPVPIVTNTPTPIVTKINQVPINQLNASQVVTRIPSNVKMENDSATMISNMLRDVIAGGTQTVGSTVVTGTTGTGISTITNNHLNASSSSSNIPSLLMSSIQQQSQQTAVHQLSNQQQPQQHIIFRQITQSSQTPHQQQHQMQNSGGIVNATASNYTTDGSGAIVIATSTTSPTKRQTNGPTDKNAIQTILKQRYANRRLNLRQDSFEAVLAQAQQKQHQHQQQQQQQQQHLIKIPQLPVIVPDLNFQQQNQQQGQQQQSQQQQQNAAVAVAANHNYSLHPTAQSVTIIGHQQQSGNKIILNSSGTAGTVASGTNFTITTPIQDLPTKIQYSQMPSSNIKVNLVTSAGIQQGSLIMDAKNSEMVKTSLQQHQQAQITMATGQQQSQTLQHPARKAMFIDPDQKRVLCKLVNLSSLQPKNSAGQTVQVSSAAAAHLFSKAQTVQRLGNSAIVANMRTLVNNQVMGTTANTVATAGTGNVNPMVQAAATAGLIAGSVGDITTHAHKAHTGNSGGGAGNGGGDPGTNVVSSGINLNTTNR